MRLPAANNRECTSCTFGSLHGILTMQPDRNSELPLPRKPWNSDDVPLEVFEPVGMIGPEERSCFYWLARNCLSGQGNIVDAGSFVGASAFCFAAGAADGNHRTFRDRPILHAYDYFSAIDAYVVDAIRKKFRHIEKGESYLDIFESRTRKYAALIEAHPGDFLTQCWNGNPIELLFVDIAKTARLNSHVIAEFFPSLIPGQSIVVHQDYFHCWHPYIHIGMEFLSDEFELIDDLVKHQSRVWRLAKPLPAEKIARLAAYDLSEEERMMLLGRVVEKSSKEVHPMMEVVRLYQRCLDRDFASARRDLDRLRRDHDIDRRHELWSVQARKIENEYGKRMAIAAL